MNTVILTLLLIMLVLIGWQMSRPVERFHDTPSTATGPTTSVAVVMENIPTRLQVDTLKRDQQAVAAANSAPAVSGCKNACANKCPDMSKYIKKDEIPCWNCTL